MHMYQGMQHGFHNDTTPRYDEAGAKLAWQRTVAFFREHLEGLSGEMWIIASITEALAVREIRASERTYPRRVWRRPVPAARCAETFLNRASPAANRVTVPTPPGGAPR